MRFIQWIIWLVGPHGHFHKWNDERISESSSAIRYKQTCAKCGREKYYSIQKWGA